MKKSSAVVMGIMAVTIVVLAFLLYRSGKEVEGTTIIVPGDTSFHKPITSNPVPVQEIRPVIPAKPVKPIIVYLKDSSGNVFIDTNEIKARYEAVICELEALLTDYETIRLYSDTINDTTAKVRAVIQDKVTENRLQAGREVSFMNLRPISIKTVTLDRKGAVIWGIAMGYNFQIDPLFGVNVDYVSPKSNLFGITLGTGFMVPKDRFILFRCGMKF